MSWWMDLSTIVYGMASVAVLGLVVFLVLKFVIGSARKKAAAYKQEHPDAASIYIEGVQYYGVEIKQVDGEKPVSFSPPSASLKSGFRVTYVLPGEHTLTISHMHMDESYTKTAEYKKNKVLNMRFKFEAKKDYTLNFEQSPGNYEIVEGKPEDE